MHLLELEICTLVGWHDLNQRANHVCFHPSVTLNDVPDGLTRLRLNVAHTRTPTVNRTDDVALSSSSQPMDSMKLALRILIFFKLALFILLIIFASVYALPICLLSRFRTPLNIMTVNVCIAFTASAVFWIVAYMVHLNNALASDIISQQRCSMLNSIETIFNCYVIYSLCSVSINRFCIIHYSTKIVFKTKRWALYSIGLTWFGTTCLTLPHLILPHTSVSNQYTLACFARFRFEQVCSQVYTTSFLQLYTLFIIVVLPSVLFVGVNVLIFAATRRSTRRVRAAVVVRTAAGTSRDAHLLKHMVIIFVLFIVGWAPIYILLCIDQNLKISPIVYRSLSLLPATSSLLDLIDLLLFNHSLRQYFRELFATRAARVQTMVTHQ